MGRSLGFLAFLLVACSSNPPPKPVDVAPLEIQPMPSASTIPAPPPTAAAAGPARHGNCAEPQIGSLAPPLEGRSLERGNVGITAGRVSLVMFWATWCGPCQKEMPEIQRIYAKASSRGLDVLAISVDDEKTGIAEFVHDRGVHYPVIWDEGHAISECWRPTTMPTAVIVDRSGYVRFRHDGYRAGDDATIGSEIESLL
jgi:thiol-disulfide isomerase/thioredoxin